MESPEPRPSNAERSSQDIRAREDTPELVVASPSSSDVNSRLGDLELEGSFAAHLLSIFSTLPASWLPVLRAGLFDSLFEAFEDGGRRVDELGEDYEVLAFAMLAYSSRASAHPLLIGCSAPHSLPGIPSLPHDPSDSQSIANSSPDDLREYGKRREKACQALKQRAIQLATERGTTLRTSAVNVASAYVLDMIETRDPSLTGTPFRASYVNQLRVLAEESHETFGDAWVWPGVLMREALMALNDGTAPFFNNVDDVLLRSQPPQLMQELLHELDAEEQAGADVLADPFSPDFAEQVRRLHNTITFAMTRLARHCAEKITIPANRGFSLDLTFARSLSEHLTTLEALLRHLYSRSTAVLALPADTVNARALTRARFGLVIAHVSYPSLVLPVYLALQDHTSTRVPESVLGDLKARALGAIRLLATYPATRTPSWLATHIPLGTLSDWVAVLREAETVAAGEEGLTVEEKKREMRWLVAGLQRMGWAWGNNNDALIDDLEAQLAELDVAHQHTPCTSQTPPNLSLVPSASTTAADVDKEPPSSPSLPTSSGRDIATSDASLNAAYRA
ncbi:hypothetical protein JCM10213_008174 [Rhodosporidiobolus nylandii]